MMPLDTIALQQQVRDDLRARKEWRNAIGIIAACLLGMILSFWI